MQVVAQMRLLVVLADRVYHLHVLLVVVLQRVLRQGLLGDGAVEDVPDLLAALRKLQQEGRVETVLLAYLGRGLLQGQLVEPGHQGRHFRQRLLALLEDGQQQLLVGTGVFFHRSTSSIFRNIKQYG